MIQSSNSLFEVEIPRALTDLCKYLDPTGMVFQIRDKEPLTTKTIMLAKLIKAYGDARVAEEFGAIVS